MADPAEIDAHRSGLVNPNWPLCVEADAVGRVPRVSGIGPRVRQFKERPMTLTDFLLARIAEDEDAIDLAVEENRYWPYRLPSSARAECEAKRRIVGSCVEESPMEGAHILRLLALPYADHPDYREEWKP